MSPNTPTPPPPPDDLIQPARERSRFTSEVMAGGAVGEGSDDELVGGWRGMLGVGAVVALFIALAVLDIWWFLFAVLLLWAIFMHELGHFVTARWTGMKATQFFIGFGPRLWSFRRGETEYGLRALPLGAFVRIIGMNRMDEVDPADEQRTYRVKSFPRRLLVISAGSIMHMLIAIALLFTVYVADGEAVERDGAVVATPAVDSDAIAVSGAALAAGVEPGDVILEVDGQPVAGPTELGQAVREHQPGDTVALTVLRGGAVPERAETVQLNAVLEPSFGADDRILEVDGQPVDGDAEIAGIAESLDVGDEAIVAVDRGVGDSGEPLVSLTPARIVEGDGVDRLQPTALLGVRSGSNFETVEHSVPAAAANAVTDIVPVGWEMTRNVVKVLNPVSVFSHVAGTNDDIETRPTTLIGVGSVTDDVGRSEGIIGVLFLMAVLNIFVGVFNMFPLLPLDGGHAAVAIYERIREAFRSGKERYYADVEKLMPLAMAVVLLLGFLFMSGLYLDITDPI